MPDPDDADANVVSNADDAEDTNDANDGPKLPGPVKDKSSKFPEGSLKPDENLPGSSCDAKEFHRYFLDICGFNDTMMTHILQKTHERQDRRSSLQWSREQQPQPTADKPRGRTARSTRKILRDEDYFARQNKKLEADDILMYFLILLHAGISRHTSIRDYFRAPTEYEEKSEKSDWFALTRMSYERFVYISQVIDFDVDWLTNHLESSICNCYQHTAVLLLPTRQWCQSISETCATTCLFAGSPIPMEYLPLPWRIDIFFCWDFEFVDGHVMTTIANHFVLSSPQCSIVMM